jgi:23S rRNA pseudouridine1911/1915/1917 synthase
MRRDGAQVWHVSAADAGQSLLSYLRRRQPADSASNARQLLRNRQVQIDGNLCEDAQRRLKQGEVVRVLPYPRTATPTAADIRIHYLDDQLVVVEKPSGMTTMRHAEERQWSDRRQRREATLDDLLPAVIADAVNADRPKRGRASRSVRPRVIPVHRLDRETSGLMVFARTLAAERSLVEQFREHSVDRAYLAIACGEVAPQTFASFLVRDRGDGKRGSTTDADLGQRAVTHVRPIESVSGFTLVECRLETGRTHQIRIHLSEAGHPICGDREYRGALGRPPIPDRSGAPRLALHAAVLGFQHPQTHERLLFETRLPRDLFEFLKRLRKAPPEKPSATSQQPSKS